MLAGDKGQVVRLSGFGVRALNRDLSPAEVQSIRKALSGACVHRPSVGDDLMGYVCAGRVVGGGQRGVLPSATTAVAVADHANLTFRSPLGGPNADSLGPRFPTMSGLYSPHVVESGLRGLMGGIPSLVVAEVGSRLRLSPFEQRVVQGEGIHVVTDELAAVAVLAAHLGCRLAAAILLEEKGR